MPFRSYKSTKRTYKPRAKRAVPRRGRKLQQQQAIIPYHNAARNAGLLAMAGRMGYNAINERIAQMNRNVNYRNTERRAKAQAKPKLAPVQSIQADMTAPIVSKVSLTGARPLGRRELKLGFWKRILRWQRVNTMNAGGAYPGQIILSHTTVGTGTRSPCVLFCLNQSTNSDNNTAGPCYYLDFNNTGGVSLTQINPQNSDGTSLQAKYILESQSPYSYSTSVDPDIRYIMNAWYDIRMNCYGATSQPTEYVIEIISFYNQFSDPLETPSNQQEIDDRHATYQGLVHKFMFNPIMPVLSHGKKKYKVHASVRFTLQPTLTIENDATGQNKIVKMFVKDGSIYDYCYHADGFKLAGADDKLSTTNYVLQGSADSDYSDTPNPKARKWLVIRALNTTRSEAETSANIPSFDLLIRKGEYCQAR